MKQSLNICATAYITNYLKVLARYTDFWKKNRLSKKMIFKEELLFSDKYMEIFSSPSVANTLSPLNDLKAVADNLATINPIIPGLLAVRHKCFNELISKAIKEENVKQIIMLGAGFDTRSLDSEENFRSSSINFFEVDQSELFVVKKKVLADNFINSTATYIGINYLSENLIDVLIDEKVNFSLSTLVLWEGNIVYLPIFDIYRIIKNLSNKFSNKLKLTFDYFSDSVIGKNTGHEDITELVDLFDKLGAYFITGIDDIYAFSKEVDGYVCFNMSANNLLRRYGLDLNPDAKFLNYSVCALDLTITI